MGGFKIEVYISEEFDDSAPEKPKSERMSELTLVLRVNAANGHFSVKERHLGYVSPDRREYRGKEDEKHNLDYFVLSGSIDVEGPYELFLLKKAFDMLNVLYPGILDEDHSLEPIGGVVVGGRRRDVAELRAFYREVSEDYHRMSKAVRRAGMFVPGRHPARLF